MVRKDGGVPCQFTKWAAFPILKCQLLYLFTERNWNVDKIWGVGGIFQHCSEEFQEWGAHTWHGLLCRCLARQRKQQGIHGWGLASQIAQWVSIFSLDFDQSVDYFSYLFDRSLWVNEIGRGWEKLTSCVQDSRFSSGYCGSHQGSQCTGLALKKTQERKLHFHASNLKMMETWTHKAEVSHISWAYPHWTHGVIIRSL